MKCSSFSNCSSNIGSACVLNRSECLKQKGLLPNAKCDEKGKKYILNNDTCKSYVLAKYHVDGGVIQGNVVKCDYLILCYGQNGYKAVFVELKGKNNRHACEQIYASINELKPSLKNTLSMKCFARIVNTKTVPDDKLNSAYMKLVKLLQNVNKDSGIYVVFKGKELEECVDKIRF